MAIHRYPARLLIAACYVATFLFLDWASYIRPLQGLNITPWNPPPALAIALLIWNPRWVGLVWAGLMASELVVRGIPADWPAAMLSSVALSAVYAGIARALALRLDFPHPFSSLRSLSWFTATAVVGSLAGGVVYVGAYRAVGEGPAGPALAAIAKYWVGDAVGIMVTLPILLLALHRPSRLALAATLRSRWWWFSAFFTCACLGVVFSGEEQNYFRFFYILLLPVVWTAARYGVAGAALTSLVTQLGLLVSVYVSFARDLAVFELQALMAASTMTALLVGVLVDERVRVAAELKISLRFAAAGQMAGALAHELSQPLAALKNYADAYGTIAAQVHDVPSPQLQQLAGIAQRMDEQAQRAGEVVKRLRDFFKTGATALELLHPANVLLPAVEAQLRYAQGLGVSISSSVDADLPPLWMDPLQIAVVLRNLIANAIESACGASPGARVQVSATRSQGQLLVEVQDNGPGIDAARLHSIFEGLPSRKSGGLGLGLGICRMIVEAHGGKLWAEPGPGGHFFFLLPVDE